MLQILRFMLVASRPSRANMIAESRFRAAVERLRQTASGAGPFDWMHGRWSAIDDDPTIARLVDAFERIWTRLR